MPNKSNSGKLILGETRHHVKIPTNNRLYADIFQLVATLHRSKAILAKTEGPRRTEKVNEIRKEFIDSFVPHEMMTDPASNYLLKYLFHNFMKYKYTAVHVLLIILHFAVNT